MAVFTDEELRLFDGYVHGTLAATERLQLEQQLSSSKEVNNRFSFYHALVHQIQHEAGIEKKLKERFKKLDGKEKHRKWLLFFALAASISGVALFFLWLRPPQHSLQEAVAPYRVEEPGLPVVMDYETSSTWTTAMQLYKQQKIAEALKIVRQKAPSDTSLFFTGLFEELLGEKETAIALYKQLQNTGRATLFAEKAQYRLAILLWEKGNQPAARSLLTLIAKNPLHFYQMQAKKALTALSK